jgi:DNA-binding XRE family transcriptional regulator
MTQRLSTVDTLINNLRTEYARRKLTKRKLAEQAGLHPNTLNNFGKDSWAPSIYTLRILEGVLLPDGQSAANAA